MPRLSRIGALTTLQSAVSTAVNGASLTNDEAPYLVAIITGTFTNITVNWEGSYDGGTTWQAVGLLPLTTMTRATTATAAGIYVFEYAFGVTAFRARTTIGAVTGTMTVQVRLFYGW